MNAQQAFDSIHEDLESVEDVLHGKGAGSEVALLSRVGDHILTGGGKRFRPALTLLCGRLSETPREQSVPLAASVELVHNATLLHDDIIDEASLRRGKTAAHLLWGDTAGVLAANFHFSLAFSLILDAGGIACLKPVIKTLHEIIEGELLQFLRIGSSDTDEGQYREIIRRKTACLIATACHIGALPGSRSSHAGALTRFGHDLGMAFQMMDDLLDYTADEAVLGKRVGTDFRESKFTLPLIVALQRCSEGERQKMLRILDASLEEKEDGFPWARDLITRNGGFDYTHQVARTYTDRALDQLDQLPQSDDKQALTGLANFVVERVH